MSRASKAKLRRQLAKEHRSRTVSAWHEAAHAVTAEYFDIPVESVTCIESVDEGEVYLGRTALVNRGQLMEVSEARAIYMVMQYSAGSVCEWHQGTTQHGYIDPGDIEDMRDTVETFELADKLTRIFAHTEGFLEWAWDVVKAAAAELVSCGQIDGAWVREIVRRRLGYIPQDNQVELFEGVVVQPGSEASTRKPYKNA